MGDLTGVPHLCLPDKMGRRNVTYPDVCALVDDTLALNVKQLRRPVGNSASLSCPVLGGNGKDHFQDTAVFNHSDIFMCAMS